MGRILTKISIVYKKFSSSYFFQINFKFTLGECYYMYCNEIIFYTKKNTFYKFCKLKKKLFAQ